MRQFAFVSIVAGLALAAPAAHAGVAVSAETAHHNAYGEGVEGSLGSAALRRPVDRNSLTQSNTTFAQDDARSVLDSVKELVSDDSVAAPARRNALARTDAAPTKAAVLPEPATWVMLLLGFGAFGALLRRKLKKSEERFNARIRRIESGETT